MAELNAAYEPTKEDIETMAHALGSSTTPKGKPLGWRNHYFDGVNSAACSHLVDAGLMRAGAVKNDGRDRYFYVTDAGIYEVRKAGYQVEEP